MYSYSTVYSICYSTVYSICWPENIEHNQTRCTVTVPLIPSLSVRPMGLVWFISPARRTPAATVKIRYPYDALL